MGEPRLMDARLLRFRLRPVPGFRGLAMNWRFALSWLVLWAVGGAVPSATLAQGPPPLVLVAQVKGTIDLGLAPYISRVLKEAQDSQAAAVVLQINTFGGRVDAAVQIRDALLASHVRTIAYVDRRAISAGALIALATHTIVMSGGATLGAAAPVTAGPAGTTDSAVGEKTLSYVRKEFRATAESRNRPPLLAEAMVDADIAVAGVIDKGKLLTLTTDEALRLRMAELQASTLEQALERAGIAHARWRVVPVNWAEELVRVLTHPVVSSLLVTLAMLGIILELRTPGFGVPGLVGLGSLALMLWGHWLVRLAGWEEMLLILTGVVLLAVEFFVLPGLGVAGVLGAGALLAGLALSMLGAGSTAAVVLAVAGRLLLSLAVALAASLLLLRWLSRFPGGRRLVLDTALSAASGYASAPASDAKWLGQRGVAQADLHPSGIADIGGHRLDVVSEGGLIEAGQAIEVIRVDGNRIVVRTCPSRTHSDQGGNRDDS